MSEIKVFSTLYESPVGMLRIATTTQGVCRVAFVDDPEQEDNESWLNKCSAEDAGDDSLLLRRFRKELDRWFAGKIKEFSLDVDILRGTTFQRRVWKELTRIPYGKTASYGDIARRIRKPQAARAVGMANHANDISIVIPCHRVISSAGKLHGYGGGLWRKEYLLRLEQAPGFSEN